LTPGSASAVADNRAIATTTRIALDGVSRRSPEAARLLTLCSFLAAEEIPRQLLFRGARGLSDDLGAPVRSAAALIEPIEVLATYALVDVRGDSISVHRTLQALVRDDLAEGEQARWAAAVATIVLNAFPERAEDSRHATWAGRVLPHARVAAEHLERLGVEPLVAVRLHDRVARFVMSQGQIDAARELLTDALERVKQIEPDGELFASVLNHLAVIERELGHFNRARQDATRALAIHQAGSSAPGAENRRASVEPSGLVERTRKAAESKLAPDSEVADDLRNLGLIAQRQGDYAEAFGHLSQALEMRRELVGEEAPAVADAYVDLFGLMVAAGRLREAILALERAIQIGDKVDGPESDDVIISRHVLSLLTDPENAVANAHRVLERSAAAYGPRHPDTASAYGLVAEVLRRLGELDDARAMALRALELDRGNFGERHFRVGSGLVTLLVIEATAGDFEAAERLLREAIEIPLDAQPEERATTLRLLGLHDALASVAASERARPVLNRVRRVLEDALASDDAALVPARDALMKAHLAAGDVLLRAGEHEDAVAHYDRGMELALLTRDNPLDDIDFYIRRAFVAALDGDAHAAREQVARAVDNLREFEVPEPVWTLVSLCSPLYAEFGRPAAAGAALRELIEDDLGGATMPQFRAAVAAAVPNGWFAKESTTLLAPDGQANIIVSSEPLDPSIDTDRYASAQGELLEKEFPQFKQKRFERMTMLGGREGYIREFEWTPEDGAPVTQLQLYYAEEGRGYNATATTPSAGFAERELVLLEALQALRIVD
jgi:tetratricopeptide (TPR) repeat protein